MPGGVGGEGPERASPIPSSRQTAKAALFKGPPLNLPQGATPPQPKAETVFLANWTRS